MQIQVDTDKHIPGSAELKMLVEAALNGALSGFSDWITRVDVQLSDEGGSQKSDSSDKMVT